MTKLMEWLSLAALLLGLWSTLLSNPTEITFLKENRLLILLLPAILIGCFGIYAASVVIFRVLTFNNCEQAAEELQKEIKLAKEDLKKKGFVFD